MAPGAASRRVQPALPALLKGQFAEAPLSALPSPFSTCKADLLLVGSLDSEGSPLGPNAAAAIDCAGGTTAGAAAAVAATPAGAGPAVPPARGSADSSSSHLLDAPPCVAEPAPACAPEAAASAAALWATSDAVGEAAQVLPYQYLSELAAANACLKRLPLPGGCTMVAGEGRRQACVTG